MYKPDNFVWKHPCDFFPYKLPLREERLLENIKNGKLFHYVQCIIRVPENLRENFANFSATFKNNNVFRDDFGLSMKEYAEEERLLIKSRRMLK